jgi:hypothetical protein
MISREGRKFSSIFKTELLLKKMANLKIKIIFSSEIYVKFQILSVSLLTDCDKYLILRHGKAYTRNISENSDCLHNKKMKLFVRYKNKNTKETNSVNLTVTVMKFDSSRLEKLLISHVDSGVWKTNLSYLIRVGKLI